MVLFGSFWRAYTGQVYARSVAPTPFRTVSKAHSRKLVVARPATNILVDGVLSSGTTCSCYILPGYRHTCCEDLLRVATGCCSWVAEELVLCSTLVYAALTWLHRTNSP